MEKTIGAVLEEGRIYKNRNGQEYKCIWTGELCAGMQNIRSGWFCVAHGVNVYEDETIDWSFSVGGHYAEL